jgi:Zn-dependent membrane protease YugP
MRYALFLSMAVALALVIGCRSSQKDVKSDYFSQWTSVAADPKTTTDAAKAVLMDHSLTDVTSKATNVDGMASGKKADGTKIAVDVTRETDTTSKVKVSVGHTGDPTLGAEIARQIKDRAEKKM